MNNDIIYRLLLDGLYVRGIGIRRPLLTASKRRARRWTVKAHAESFCRDYPDLDLQIHAEPRGTN